MALRLRSLLLAAALLAAACKPGAPPPSPAPSRSSAPLTPLFGSPFELTTPYPFLAANFDRHDVKLVLRGSNVGFAAWLDDRDLMIHGDEQLQGQQLLMGRQFYLSSMAVTDYSYPVLFHGVADVDVAANATHDVMLLHTASNQGIFGITWLADGGFTAPWEPTTYYSWLPRLATSGDSFDALWAINDYPTSGPVVLSGLGVAPTGNNTINTPSSPVTAWFADLAIADDGHEQVVAELVDAGPPQLQYEVFGSNRIYPVTLDGSAGLGGVAAGYDGSKVRLVYQNQDGGLTVVDIAPDGGVLGSSLVTGSGTNPAIGCISGACTVAYDDGNFLYVASPGTIAPINVSGVSSASPSRPSVAGTVGPYWFVARAQRAASSNTEVLVDKRDGSLNYLAGPLNLAESSDDQQNAAIAADQAGTYMVAFEDRAGGNPPNVQYVFFDGGIPIRFDMYPSALGSCGQAGDTVPAVAAGAAGEFLVAVQGTEADAGTLVCARYEGASTGALVTVSNATGTQSQPAVAYSPGLQTYLLAWRDTSDGTVHGLISSSHSIDASFSAVLDTAHTEPPAVAGASTDFMLVTGDSNAGGGLHPTAFLGGVLDSTLSLPALGLTGAKRPTVASDGTSYAIAWQDASSNEIDAVVVARLPDGGLQEDAPVTIQSTSGAQNWTFFSLKHPVVAALAPHLYGVFYEVAADQDGGMTIDGRLLADDGTLASDTFQATDSAPYRSGWPAVASSGQQALIAYERMVEVSTGGPVYSHRILTGRMAVSGAFAFGGQCTVDQDCLNMAVNGTCVDGVCCNTPCYGRGTDAGAAACAACSVAAGAKIDGFCQLLSGNVCAAGDPANCRGDSTCDGVQAACPYQPPASSSTVCATGGVCQNDSTCSGQSYTCPVLQPAFPGTPCPGDAGPCQTFVCDGSNNGLGACGAVPVTNGISCDDGTGAIGSCYNGGCVAYVDGGSPTTSTSSSSGSTGTSAGTSGGPGSSSGSSGTSSVASTTSGSSSGSSSGQTSGSGSSASSSTGSSGNSTTGASSSSSSSSTTGGTTTASSTAAASSSSGATGSSGSSGSSHGATVTSGGAGGSTGGTPSADALSCASAGSGLGLALPMVLVLLAIRRRRGALLLALLALPLSARAEGKPRKVKIAVMTLQPGVGVDPKIADLVGTRLTSAIQSQTGASVISDKDIANALGLERTRQLLGCSENSCMAELGGALGVDYLVTGTLGHLGHSLTFDAQVMNVSKAVVIRPYSHGLQNASDEAFLDEIDPAVRALFPGEGGAAAASGTAGASAEVRTTPAGEAPSFVFTAAGAHELTANGGLSMIRAGYQVLPQVAISVGGVLAGTHDAGALVHGAFVPVFAEEMIHPVIGVGVPVIFGSSVEVGGLASAGVELVPVKLVAISVDVTALDLFSHPAAVHSFYALGGGSVALRF